MNVIRQLFTILCSLLVGGAFLGGFFWFLSMSYKIMGFLVLAVIGILAVGAVWSVIASAFSNRD